MTTNSWTLQRILVGEDGQNYVEPQDTFPRYQGVTAPNNDGWAIGECWLDMSTLTNSVDAKFRYKQANGDWWPLPSGATPGPTPLLADDYTGTDGQPWDAAKWGLGRAFVPTGTVDVPGTRAGGGATLLSGTGVLAASSSTVNYDPGSTVSRRAIITDVADVQVYLRFKWDATSSFFGIHLRHSTNAIDRKDGYWLQCMKQDNKWHVGELDGSYANTVLGTEQTLGWAEDTWYKARFQIVGSAIKAKVWNASGGEPGAWGVEVTDSTYASAGKVGLSISGGLASSAVRRVFVDDLVITAAT